MRRTSRSSFTLSSFIEVARLAPLSAVRLAFEYLSAANASPSVISTVPTLSVDDDNPFFPLRYAKLRHTSLTPGPTFLGFGKGCDVLDVFEAGRWSSLR